jgi:hypothetical protein
LGASLEGSVLLAQGGKLKKIRARTSICPYEWAVYVARRNNVGSFSMVGHGREILSYKYLWGEV